mgnify:CR=1 FL=1
MKRKNAFYLRLPLFNHLPVVVDQAAQVVLAAQVAQVVLVVLQAELMAGRIMQLVMRNGKDKLHLIQQQKQSMKKRKMPGLEKLKQNKQIMETHTHKHNNK